MNAEKVIELGKVSEETKGHIGMLEYASDFSYGPPA